MAEADTLAEWMEILLIGGFPNPHKPYGEKLDKLLAELKGEIMKADEKEKAERVIREVLETRAAYDDLWKKIEPLEVERSSLAVRSMQAQSDLNKLLLSYGVKPDSVLVFDAGVVEVYGEGRSSRVMGAVKVTEGEG
jgi:hypothetical protein